MCIRFNCRIAASDLHRFFRVADPPEPIVRYNVSATQNVLVVRADETGKRHASYVEWGLIPGWSRDARVGTRMMLSKGETVAALPQYRSAFKRRRCLVVASGYYEWNAQDPKEAHAWHIRFRDGAPMAFAGIWEAWKSPEGSLVESCAIITTLPNRMISLIGGSRMPVVVRESRFEEWLNPLNKNVIRLQDLLAPCRDSWLAVDAVDSFVKDPRNEGPQCIEPLQTGSSKSPAGKRPVSATPQLPARMRLMAEIPPGSGVYPPGSGVYNIKG